MSEPKLFGEGLLRFRAISATLPNIMMMIMEVVVMKMVAVVSQKKMIDLQIDLWPQILAVHWFPANMVNCIERW